MSRKPTQGGWIERAENPSMKATNQQIWQTHPLEKFWQDNLSTWGFTLYNILPCGNSFPARNLHPPSRVIKPGWDTHYRIAGIVHGSIAPSQPHFFLAEGIFPSHVWSPQKDRIPHISNTSIRDLNSWSNAFHIRFSFSWHHMASDTRWMCHGRPSQLHHNFPKLKVKPATGFKKCDTLW